MVRVLFLGADIADYLSISVLNGLKSLPGVEVVDYPKGEVLYRTERERLAGLIRGRAHFTAFFLHQDEPVNRFHVTLGDLDKFDLVIVGDIHSAFGYYVQLLPHLAADRTAILDGSDSVSLYPYNGHYWRRPYYWFLPRVHNRFRYFKREWTEETLQYRYFRCAPLWLCRFIPPPRRLRPISFAIPDDKVVSVPPLKTQDFPRHIVDPEVAVNVPGSSTAYVYDTEPEYYADLQRSRFGVTTKRGGWDCMRHYEIAANGAVICFRDFDQKPPTCAPHGLVGGRNCLSYRSFDELASRISRLTADEYLALLEGSLAWARANTCTARALQLLSEFGLASVAATPGVGARVTLPSAKPEIAPVP